MQHDESGCDVIHRGVEFDVHFENILSFIDRNEIFYKNSKYKHVLIIILMPTVYDIKKSCGWDIILRMGHLYLFSNLQL
jgi:hypothetical protein